MTKEFAVVRNGTGESAVSNKGLLNELTIYEQKVSEKRAKSSLSKLLSNVDMVKTMSDDKIISDVISKITRCIKNGQEDNSLEAYNELLAEMKKQDRFADVSGDETQLKTAALILIDSSLGKGVKLENLIRKYAKKQGRVEELVVFTWGNCDQTSKETLLKEMCNIDEDCSHGNWLLLAAAGLLSPLFVVGNGILGGKGIA